MNHTALALALSLSLFTLSASAQTNAPITPPDVVMLRDGSLFRGTLVERSPERVVLMLATGETRTWAPADVESAGPDIVLPQPQAIVAAPAQPQVIVAAPEPLRPRAVLHVRTSRDDLTLHLLDTSTTLPSPGRFTPVTLDAFRPLCVAPCDTAVDAGSHILGISRGDGAAVRGGPPMALEGERWLSLEHEDRTGLRIGGWILMFAGPAIGGAFAGLWAAQGWFSDQPSFGEVMLPVGLGLLGTLIGGIMVATNDHNAVRVHERDIDVDVEPIAPPPPPEPRARRVRPRQVEPDAY